MALRAFPLPCLLQPLPRSPPNDHLTDSLVSVSEALVGPSRPFQKSGLVEQGGLGWVLPSKRTPGSEPWLLGCSGCTFLSSVAGSKRDCRVVTEACPSKVCQAGVCKGWLIWFGRGCTTGAPWPSAVSVHKPNFSPSTVLRTQESLHDVIPTVLSISALPVR